MFSDSSAFYTFIGILSLFLFVQSVPVNGADSTAYTTFPVSNYYELSHGRTGNNHYYDMQKNPTKKQILTVGGGYQDLLLYEDGRFRVQVLPRKIYSYGIDWHPQENYALVVGSRLPPKSAGLVLKYTNIDTGTRLLKTVSENLTGVDFNSNGTALIVGGTIAPQPSNIILRYRDNTFERIDHRDTSPLKSVAWRPNSTEALMVGPGGTIFHYKNGNVNPVSVNTDVAFFSVAWAPSGDRALIGGENGTLYRWKNGYLLEVTTDHSWDIRDIAWHPSGDKALLVGGTRDGNQGYWGIYQSLELSSSALSKPFFSAEWLDNNNALIGGQKVLWRISSGTDTRSLGLKPSLSLKNRTAKTGERLLVSGFGSTAHGSVQNISAYQFKIDQRPPGKWQNKVAAILRLQQPGQHTIGLRVKDDNGAVSDWTYTTVRITGNPAGSVYPFNWSLYELITMLALAGLALLVIGWLFWDDLRSLLGSWVGPE